MRDENIEILSNYKVKFRISKFRRGGKKSKIRKRQTFKVWKYDANWYWEREKYSLWRSVKWKKIKWRKNSLFNTEKKYYDLEKQTQSDLQIATEKLKDEQDELEKNIKKKRLA